MPKIRLVSVLNALMKLALLVTSSRMTMIANPTRPPMKHHFCTRA